MGIVIGLDIGGSTTKVVGFDQNKVLDFAMVKSSDPVASAYGGLGKFLATNNLELANIEKIMVTGVGASYIGESLMERPTQFVDEFDCVGFGSIFISDFENAVIICMGTGTSMVYCDGQRCEHIIGSGVGGGTVLGLASRLLNVHNFESINHLAAEGDLSRVDLTIGDISKKLIPGLKADTTASNFGKVTDDADNKDLAKGLVNLVFQSVGTSAILSSRLYNTSNIIVVGSLTRLKEGHKVLEKFSELYQKNICIPEKSEYATAIGAALMADKTKS